MKPGIAALSLFLTVAPLPAQLGGFRAGDLYLYTPSTVTSGYMVLHIDPLAATTTPLIHTQATGSQLGAAAYDPFRDRILISAGLTSATVELWAVDAAGNATSLGLGGIRLRSMAARGDGTVYCQSNTGGSNEIQYVDASGNLQTLMDAAGSAPFAAPALRRMAYHPGENALFLAGSWSGSGCAGAGSGSTTVYKVPLSMDGSRAVGPVTCNSFLVSTSAEEAEGLGLAPGGELLLVVDTNSNAREPRMLLVDPVSLAFTPFAQNGSYTGAATTDGGIWSQVAGKAVIVDTFNDVLRAYGPGEVGNGTALPPTGVSAGGHSEILTMLEIGPPVTPGTFHGSPRSISLSGGGSQTLQFTGGAAFGGDTYWMLGSVSGWNPGTLFRGTRLWVVPDFYTDYTVVSANAGFLSNTLGTLGATGSATGAVTLPPGMPAALAGFVVHHACGVFDHSLNPLFSSNPVSLQLVP